MGRTSSLTYEETLGFNNWQILILNTKTYFSMESLQGMSNEFANSRNYWLSEDGKRVTTT